MALTVGVATVLDSREVVVVVTGQRKALALSKAIGESASGICMHRNADAFIRGGDQSPGMSSFASWMTARVTYMCRSRYCQQWTLSALQMHPWALIVVDEDATAELHVKTVKYFRSIERVQDEVEAMHAKLKDGIVDQVGME